MTLKIPQGKTLSIGSGSKTLGAGGWTPLQLPNLLAWYDATDLSTIDDSTTSGRVEEWQDKSGNGHHVTQSTLANKPYTGIRTIGGLNALDFREDQLLFRNDALGIEGGTNPAITFIAMIFPDNVVDNKVFLSLGDVNSGSLQLAGISSDYSWRYVGSNSIFSGPSAGQPILIVTKRTGTTGNEEFRANRVDLNVSSTASSGSSIVPSSYFIIGDSNTSNNTPYDGALSEIIICNKM